MSKPDPNLFQIGQAAKLMGVSRKMILHYEELGLLLPAYKDENSGYRYYTADNLTQIRYIRALQSLGLSLSEVREYYYDSNNIEVHIKRLTDLREDLDKNIQMLQMRASKIGDMTVRWTTLPEQSCFCKRYFCEDTAQAAAYLRETYIAAAHTGYMTHTGHIFTMRMGEDLQALDLLCCIPIQKEYSGSEGVFFPETRAVCIYYRGAYEGIGTAISALQKYMQEKHLQSTDHVRSIYLEGPPNRGSDTSSYITQVAIPIAEEG